MSLLVFLVGLSGSGKSTVGKLLADRLGLRFLDTDAEVEGRSGRGIAEIFAQDGEAAFRALESAVVHDACALPAAVIATGGGALLDAANAEAMHGAGSIFWLDAPTPVLAMRLDEDEAASRPLLQPDPTHALERLRAAREAVYRAHGRRIETAEHTPTEIAEAVALALARDRWPAPESDVVQVRAPSQPYPVYVGQGLLGQAGALLDQQGLRGRVHVVADERVLHLHGESLREGLADRRATWHPVPPGEESKNLEHASQLYDSLLAERPERDDVLVAFGGGVTGDLGGFVAATLLRGLRFVQIPTTLLAQVDSSVGGKVGIDHARGKNLIGAFHQPNLVLAEIGVLGTLPEREVAAGWAEVVKIAVALDADLFEFVERSLEALGNLEAVATRHAICRAIELKARLVERDERDTLGVRALLNYGHTVGHAIEARVGYGRYLHGEAVAIGMAAAAHIACQMGLLPAEIAARQERVLTDLGLPQRCPDTSPPALRATIGLDKKRSNGAIGWVLPLGLGQAQSGMTVPDPIVDEALDWVTRAKS